MGVPAMTLRILGHVPDLSGTAASVLGFMQMLTFSLALSLIHISPSCWPTPWPRCSSVATAWASSWRARAAARRRASV